MTRDPKRLFARMSEAAAPMVATLADALPASDGPLEHIDFEASYPNALRAKPPPRPLDRARLKPARASGAGSARTSPWGLFHSHISLASIWYR